MKILTLDALNRLQAVQAAYANMHPDTTAWSAPSILLMRRMWDARHEILTLVTSALMCVETIKGERE